MVIPANVAVVGDELRSTTIMPADGYELDNMFYMHNGSGLRNCTLQGSGTLGAPNDNLTRRPTQVHMFCQIATKPQIPMHGLLQRLMSQMLQHLEQVVLV